MDVLSALIASSEHPIMDFIATTIHNDIFFVFILALLVLANERNRQKLGKILFASILVVLLVLVLKNGLRIERPCSNERFAELCGSDYSFPSLHTALAFTIATAFLQKKSYPIYALFAVLVAFTRIYLGVHSFIDVAGGLAFGVVVYYLADLFLEKQPMQTIEPMKERRRQHLHILIGLSLLLLFLILGRELFLLILFIALVIGSLLANFYFFGGANYLGFLVERFERKGVKISGFGSALYLLGILILASTINDSREIAGGILLFALSDAAATLFGLRGTRPLPWNKEKKVEGMLAFFFAGLPAYLFINSLVIPLSIITSVVETIPWKVDDNISIPVTMTLFFLVF